MDLSLPFQQVVTDNARVAIVLPEGATNIRVKNMGGGMEEEEERSRRFTFLDSSYGGGRPVVRLRKRNVVPGRPLRVQVQRRPRPTLGVGQSGWEGARWRISATFFF